MCRCAEFCLKKMAATAVSAMQIMNARHSIYSSRGLLAPNASVRVLTSRESVRNMLSSVSSISSTRHFPVRSSSSSSSFSKSITRAMSGETDKGPSTGLPIDLRGLRFDFSSSCLTFCLVNFPWANAHLAEIRQL